MFSPREWEKIGDFYFTTNLSSCHAAQYRENPKSRVYFFDLRFYRGVMLTGTMKVLTDDAVRRKIWRDGDTVYYPGGGSAPAYCVLRFTAE